jgi:hypothetical protein
MEAAGASPSRLRYKISPVGSLPPISACWFTGILKRLSIALKLAVLECSYSMLYKARYV